MIYDEIWSFPYDQIEEYLYSQGALKKDSAYLAGDCLIEIEPLPQRRVGSALELPQTRVKMKGAGAEEFHHGFRMYFLSGGG